MYTETINNNNIFSISFIIILLNILENIFPALRVSDSAHFLKNKSSRKRRWVKDLENIKNIKIIKNILNQRFKE